MHWTDAFIQSEETTFSELKEGNIFAIPNTEKVNRYWKTSVNNFSPYQSPIIAKKINDNTLQELMTNFPVPGQKVDVEKAKTIKVIPVTFIDRM